MCEHSSGGGGGSSSSGGDGGGGEVTLRFAAPTSLSSDNTSSSFSFSSCIATPVCASIACVQGLSVRKRTGFQFRSVRGRGRSKHQE
jgi:hypothetical protein